MARKIYPPELEDYIRKKYEKYTSRQIAPMIEEDLGIKMTHSQVRAYIHNHGIRCDGKKRSMPETKITTPEMDAFIRDNFKGTGHQAMADLLNEKFGTSFTKEQIKGYYARNKLNSGLTGRFVKGCESWNKGKKQSDFMSEEAIERTKATRFKKGQTPPNGCAPIGEIRIRYDHRDRNGAPYKWIKTEMPNKWRMLHVVIWEEKNGKVPKGCIIRFADGDTMNCSLDNLILTTRAQHAIRNQRGLKSYDVESAKAANTLADLIVATHKRTKKKRVKKE